MFNLILNRNKYQIYNVIQNSKLVASTGDNNYLHLVSGSQGWLQNFLQSDRILLFSLIYQLVFAVEVWGELVLRQRLHRML